MGGLLNRRTPHRHSDRHAANHSSCFAEITGSRPASPRALDRLDVVGFAGERADAIGFWLKMQAQLVGSAIFRLYEAPLETVKRPLGPDVDNALGRHGKG